MTIIETAEKELGTPDRINGHVNPEVLKWFEKIHATYQPGYEELSCAAFVGYVLETVGIRSTRALNARSYLSWGNPTTKPVQGDVVVFWRGKVQSADGHVSFFHHEDENTVYCLGGNQAGEVVSIQGYPKTRVLAYRSAIKTNVPPAQPITHMEPVTPVVAIPEGAIEVLSKDGATKELMKKPNFETSPKSHYCMITAIELHSNSDATISYSNFTTDENNVIHLDTHAYMDATNCSDNDEAIAYARAHVDEGIIVEVNL